MRNCLHHQDCMIFMQEMETASVDFTLTDIPYGTVSRKNDGLRNLDKGIADVLTFELLPFLKQVQRVSKNSLLIFCAKEQFSQIFHYFAQQKGTTRAIIWHKSNPMPMNGTQVYLSGVEMAVWYKTPKGRTFNAHCKNTVFKYPKGSSRLHPTEKNHGLLKELILDNSNEGDLIFDPCAGSGAHLLVAKQLNRQFLGCEIDKHYFEIATARLF